MDGILKTINSITIDYNFVTTITAFGTLIFSIYKFKKQKKINLDFENIKYSFEHDLTNYKAYIELKHKRILKVNQCIAKAYSSVINLASQARRYPDFSVCTFNQILDFFDEISLAENVRNHIIGQWTANRINAINELRYWYNINCCNKTNDLINCLKKHLLYLRLYITEEEFNELFDFANKLEDICIDREFLLDDERGLNRTNSELRIKIQEKKDELSYANDKAIELLRSVLKENKI